MFRLIVLAFAVMPLTAYAYVDPNTGGWLFQLLFPLLVAIGGAWKYLRQRIAGLFRRRGGDGSMSGEPADSKVMSDPSGGTNE